MPKKWGITCKAVSITRPPANTLDNKRTLHSHAKPFRAGSLKKKHLEVLFKCNKTSMVFTKFWESSWLLEKPVYTIYVFMLCFFSLASFEWLPFYMRKAICCHVEKWSLFDSKWWCIVSAYRTKPGCFQKLFNWSVTLCFCRGAFSNLHHINLTCPPVLNWGHMGHLFMTTMTNMHQNRLDHGLLFIG